MLSNKLLSFIPYLFQPFIKTRKKQNNFPKKTYFNKENLIKRKFRLAGSKGYYEEVLKFFLLIELELMKM